ncbi:MAG: DUF4238 domain-containing protein [Candidatus Scalindua sp.]|nr:DUF4238 domain-containing protein [Candidatus Scalindua sp.]MCR4345516.1 DUF4238 domain-containing protein [Candidatus Scalindua sp.]
MPLDHYISQVHLKNFYSPKLGKLMYAIRKNNQKLFTPNAESVCRIPDNSTNSYLREDRLVEKFLKDIESKYNSAVAKIVANDIDAKCIYVIAGFVAYVLTCSPASMRLHSEPLKNIVEETARILDSKSVLPLPPPVLGGKNITELLKDEKVRIGINPKYPQAIGICSILSHIRMFGNFKWDILMNPFNNNPFFTSDFPVAIEKTDDHRILNRIIPLTPKLAIRIFPDISIDRKRVDFSFSGFRHSVRKLSLRDVMYINKLIVRCAETTVFFRDDYEWIPKFVKKNAGFCIESRTIRIPKGDGTLHVSSLEVREAGK